MRTSREDIQEAFAGDIVALAGLKDTTTGDTLCAPNAPIILERMEFPEPVIELSVEPKTKADQEKMGVALNRLAREDPSFRVSTDHEIGPDHHQGDGRAPPRDPGRPHEARVQGRGQCRRAAGGVSRISRQAGRRSIYTHKKQSGGSGQFGRSEGQGHAGRARFGLSSSSTRSRAATFPRNISRRSKRACARPPRPGSLIGFPIIDFEIELIDGKYHDVDSSALAFEICARGAMREVAQKAGIKLLEPIMKVEVVTPGGLSRRRHRRHEQPSRPDPGHRQPRQRADRSRRWCRWRTCSAT